MQRGEPNPAGVPQAPRSLSAKRMRPPRGLHAWPWGFFGHSHPRRGAAAVSDPLVSLFYGSPFPLLKPFPKAGAFWQISPCGGSPFPHPCNPLSAPQSLQSNTTPIFIFFQKNIKDAAHLNNYFPFFSFSIFLRCVHPVPRPEKKSGTYPFGSRARLGRAVASVRPTWTTLPPSSTPRRHNSASREPRNCSSSSYCPSRRSVAPGRGSLYTAPRA